MNKDTIELKVSPCIVSSCVVGKCPEKEKALIVATKGGEMLRFPACEKHYKGVHEAVSNRFGDNGYLVACYRELLGI